MPVQGANLMCRLLIMSCWLTVAVATAAERPAVEGAWLAAQAERIDERVATLADVAAWTKQQAKATPEDQLLIALLTERFARIHLGSSERALAVSLQSLPTTWRAVESPKRIEIAATGPVWPALGLREPATWALPRTNLLPAVALARTLIGSGRADQALVIADQAKPLMDADPVAGAWVVTVVAQAFLATNRAERALQAAVYGLKRLDHPVPSASSSSSDTPALAPANQLPLVRYDLTRLRDRAQRIWDEERYGPGFVRYRDAEWQRRVAHNEAEAWQLYAGIRQEFPGTIYAEASEAYGIACLVAFAGDAYRQRLLDRVAGVEARLKALTTAAAEMTKAGATPAAMDEQRALLKEQQELAAIFAALPATGPQAAELAITSAKAFIARDPQGLYRGEAMLAIGDVQWEVLLKPKEGQAWYRQAREWFEIITATDQAVDRFALDPRVTTVAAPPPAMRAKDDWGNVGWATVTPGMIVNHRTCAWYAPYFRLQAALRELSCAFVNGDTALAKNLLPIIGQVDPFQQTLANRGWPTMAGRLHDDIVEGRLFANREELAAFPPVFLPRLMVAELAYETERYAEARRMYAKMVRDFGDRLPGNAKAYLLYHQASDTLLANRSAGIAQFKAIAADYPNAPSWTRVKFSLYTYTQEPGPAEQEALGHLDDIIQKRSGTPAAEQALLVKGVFLAAHARQIDAVRIFTSLRTSAQPWIVRASTRWQATLAALLGLPLPPTSNR